MPAAAPITAVSSSQVYLVFDRNALPARKSLHSCTQGKNRKSDVIPSDIGGMMLTFAVVVQV